MDHSDWVPRFLESAPGQMCELWCFGDSSDFSRTSNCKFQLPKTNQARPYTVQALCQKDAPRRGSMKNVNLKCWFDVWKACCALLSFAKSLAYGNVVLGVSHKICGIKNTGNQVSQKICIHTTWVVQGPQPRFSLSWFSNCWSHTCFFLMCFEVLSQTSCFIRF